MLQHIGQRKLFVTKRATASFSNLYCDMSLFHFSRLRTKKSYLAFSLTSTHSTWNITKILWHLVQMCILKHFWYVFHQFVKSAINVLTKTNKRAFALPNYLVLVLLLFAKAITHNFSERNSNHSVEKIITSFLSYFSSFLQTYLQLSKGFMRISTQSSRSHFSVRIMLKTKYYIDIFVSVLLE